MCMGSSSTGSLVFSDVTEDRSSQKNSEVYTDILSAQIQSNAAQLIRRRFLVQMDNDPYSKTIWNILQLPSQSPDLNPIEHAFHLLKTKLKAENPQTTSQLQLRPGKASQRRKPSLC